MIVLCLGSPDGAANERDLEAHADRVGLVEYRWDQYGTELRRNFASWAAGLHSRFGKPGILTIRRTEDGGAWGGDDAPREALYRDLIATLAPGVLAWVDVEFDRPWAWLQEACASRGIGIIRSAHDFTGTPPLADLLSFVSCLKLEPGALFKYASLCRGTADLNTLLAVAWQLKEQSRDFTVLGMGEAGQATRILAPCLGSRFTYTSPARAGIPLAPGQMDPDTLEEVYHYSTLRPGTPVFGIVGNPVGHSRSPAWHNARFHQGGYHAVYVPLLVDDFAQFNTLCHNLDLRGASVTVPHKEAALAFCTRLVGGVEHIGACNTLVKDGQEWIGTNTDVDGFIEPVRGALAGTPPDLRRALLVGAGGAARAVLYALLVEGWEVWVANRSIERAERLVASMGGAARTLTLDQVDQGPWGLVVNTTSVGMAHGDSEGQDPIPSYRFTGQELVYDIIYTPALTPLLRRAREAGCRVFNGEGMFESQARGQFFLFESILRQTGLP